MKYLEIGRNVTSYLLFPESNDVITDARMAPFTSARSTYFEMLFLLYKALQRNPIKAQFKVISLAKRSMLETKIRLSFVRSLYN